jgi:hypothetical protein
MYTFPKPRPALLCLPAFLCLLIFITSCKRDDTDKITVDLKPVTASYNWGELAINKKIQSDNISYNSAGKISNVLTLGSRGDTLSNITFTYTDNKITLNSGYNDEYDLDNTGKVVYHSTQEVQQGHNIVEIERYSYDDNDYLKKITLSLTFDGGPESLYSTIDYEVANGNYTKYTLSNTDSGTVTRQYAFTYNTNRKVTSPASFFVPVFANNTLSNIDKYLNYGRASVNLLSGITYSIRNLDKTVSTGSFNVLSTVNSDGYVTSLNLAGNSIAGFPSDNLSPLPKSVSFTLK